MFVPTPCLPLSALGALATSCALVAVARAGEPPEDLTALTEALRASEIAFARTMADRDHAAFVAFIDAEAIFFAGDAELRGRDAIASAWAAYFEGETPPFSWEPTVVTVLDSGTLGLTSGPVYDPGGVRFATFSSIWRRTSDGTWRVVLDRGSAWRE
jgi:ketosteroid isomerase-like protein